ncbi:Lcl domain-containing protein [Roseateles sp. P5_E1]
MRTCVIAALALALAMPCAVMAEDAAPKLTPSADGQELIDAATGLAWSRCVEGRHWDGRRCDGEIKLFTHAEALVSARTRSEAEGRLWRVPRAQEFKRLPEHIGGKQQAAVLMPDAPSGWYWTSTVRIESEAVNTYSYANVQRGTTERQVDRLSPQTGWVVEQPGGAVRSSHKREKQLVRLVRTLAP